MFLNSDHRYYGIDLMRDHEKRSAYFARYLPDFDIASLDGRGWRRLRALRDAVRAVLEPEGGHGLERLSEIAENYPVRFVFEGTGLQPRSGLVPRRDGNEHQIAVAILASVHAAAADGRLSRFRLCDRAECGWCFYDASRNRSARWCSSDPCGDVMKARAYRDRQRGGLGSLGR